MAEPPIYNMCQVGFRYPGRNTALSGITLSIAAGERVALLGCNGSGKSTLLKLLNGLIIADSGSVYAYETELNARNLQDEQFCRSFRQRVGFIFQRSDVQLFSPSVWEEIAFGPLQLGLPETEALGRVEDVIRMLGLEALRERAPYSLSGGEQKKVAIASVLAVNPEVLLLDEPTAALDPRTQRWLVNLLQDLQRAGKTTILASHDIDLLPDLADRAIVIGEDHTVLLDEPVERVLADHDLLHTANLGHHHRAVA